MNIFANEFATKRWLGTVMTAAVLVVALTVSASATTNYVYFSINGDTSATTMVQGDTLGWGANCAVGATLTWDLWVDLNNNGVIDNPGDKLFISFDVVDGDTAASGPPPDIDPTPDGWCIFGGAVVGLAPAHYIFKGTDHTDASHAQRVITVTALPSPPNKFQGKVTIAGHPAPDALLQNLWIEADIQNGFQLWAAMTTDSGYYSINVGSQATGETFRIQPPEIPGYVTPGQIEIIADGDSTNLNFNYVAPADSLYGRIVDEHDALITTLQNVYCSPMFPGPANKNVDVSDGTYALFFGVSEEGQWQAGISSEGLVPTYLIPNGWQFRNDTIHNLSHDFVCLTSDTVMFVKVTENGAQPTHSYLMRAASDSLDSFTQSITGTGAGNIVALHISKLDHSTWNVSPEIYDDNHPIPAGYVVGPGNYTNLGPGDTATINFISGKMVQDTIKVDAGDTFNQWSSLFMSLWNASSGSTGGNPDNSGVFTIYADTGNYILTPNFTGYLFSPSSRNIHLTNDTAGGLGFTMNLAHCTVTGALQNVGLPLSSPASVNAHTTSGPSYTIGANVDQNTGVFTLHLCDGNWTLDPPFISGYISPTAPTLVIGEIPDTTKTANMAYSVFSGVDTLQTGSSLPKEFALRQNYPNPFNPSTQISFDLPSAGQVEIAVYNVLGQRVNTLVDERMSAGSHKVTWDGNDSQGRNAVSGIYFFRMTAGNYVSTKKMVLLK